MMVDKEGKVIIVEGLTDKRQIKKIINDDVDIICTNGTFGVERFDELLEDYDLDNRDVYIFVDEDNPGMKLRRQLARELPHAEHVHVNRKFREVATTPIHVLATVLAGKQIIVNPNFLLHNG